MMHNARSTRVSHSLNQSPRHLILLVRNRNCSNTGNLTNLHHLIRPYLAVPGGSQLCCNISPVPHPAIQCLLHCSAAQARTSYRSFCMIFVSFAMTDLTLMSSSLLFVKSTMASISYLLGNWINTSFLFFSLASCHCYSVQLF